MSRDNMTAQDALNRMNAQKDDEFYRSRSEFVIENADSPEQLNAQVERIIAVLKEKINGN